jgi:hypothetical protein
MRTLQAQLQDIADWIAGVGFDPEPTMADFTEGALQAAWRAVYNRAWNEDPHTYKMACLAELIPAMAGYPNGPALCQRIQRVIPSSTERPFPSLEEIADTLQPVSWLWQPWLPLGMLTLLAAQQGTGKSMLALDLARRIIEGEPWPDGSQQTRPGANVIYVDGERIPSVHNERAVAWKMPRRQLYMLLADEEDGLLALESEKYQELLAQMVYRLQPALVIIDSLGAVLSRGENGVEDVRALLGFLAGMAQAQGCAVLILHHLRKSNGQMNLFDTIDMNDVRGSGHITAMSRVAWGLKTVQTAQKADPNGPRSLHVIKSNLSRLPKALGVILEPIPGDEENARVVYDEDAPLAYEEPTERDAAGDWLLAYLEEAGEPVAPKTVVAAAQEAGYSRMTIYRAQEELGAVIVNTKGRKHPANKWTLASETDETLVE